MSDEDITLSRSLDELADQAVQRGRTIRRNRRIGWASVPAVGVVLAAVLVAMALGGGENPARVRTASEPKRPTDLAPGPAPGPVAGPSAVETTTPLPGQPTARPAEPGRLASPAPLRSTLGAILPFERQLIAFTRIEGEAGDIYLVRGDGSAVTALTHNVATGSTVRDFNAALSPDGRRVAFMSDRDNPTRTQTTFTELYVMNVDGSGVRRLTHAPADGYGAISPAWSPDGRLLAFAMGTKTRSGLWTIRPDGTGLTSLTSQPSSSGDFAPAWSPDGKRLAFSRTGAGVFVADTRGRHERKIGPGSFPSWSPDSRRLVFASADGSVAVAADDGTGLRTIATAANPGAPHWSPDGAWILYSADPDGYLDVRHVDVSQSGFGVARQGPQPALLRLVHLDGTSDHAFSTPPPTANDISASFGRMRAPS